MKKLFIAAMAVLCTHVFTSCSTDDYEEGILREVQATEGDNGHVSPPPPPVDADE